MNRPIARLGDTSTHGGKIITAAQKSVTENMRTARVTDILDCPKHGPNPIITGAPKTVVENQRCARTGSLTQCGATIIGGSKKSFCD